MVVLEAILFLVVVVALWTCHDEKAAIMLTADRLPLVTVHNTHNNKLHHQQENTILRRTGCSSLVDDDDDDDVLLL